MIFVPNFASLKLGQYEDMYTMEPVKAQENPLYEATVKVTTATAFYDIDHASTMLQLVDASFPFMKMHFKKL